MSDSIKLIKNGVKDRLDGMLTRAKSTQATARIYPLYQKLQTERFRTENASEGAVWLPLNPVYKRRKLKLFAGYPGAGSKTLIGTSTLAGAVIGPGSPFLGTEKHTALFSPYKMQIQVSMSGKTAAGKPFTYAGYVAEQRPFMEFSEKSLTLMKNELRKFLVGK